MFLFRALFLLVLWSQEVWASSEAAHSSFSWSWLFNLVLLIALLVFLTRKPISAYLFNVRNTVEKDIAEAEELRQTVERLAREYEQKLEALNEEMEDILREARAAGEREKKRILDQARQNAERVLEDARRAAEAELERMKRKLEKETLAQAAAKAERILRERITEKDHRVFTQELVSRLEALSESNQ